VKTIVTEFETSPYQQRIEQLRATKLAQTQESITVLKR